MKTYLNIFALVLLAITMYSCRTSQEIQITGEPGTEIYSPTMQRLGVLDDSGNTTITLPSNRYFAYLMSRNSTSNTLVPFALDYKHDKFVGTRVQEFIGAGLAAEGFLSELIGLANFVGGGKSSVTNLFVVTGIAETAIGIAIGLSASSRARQIQYKYRFKYLANHQTNQDISFSPIINAIIKPEEQKDTATNLTQEAELPLSTADNEISSISKRTITDYGRLLSGTYTGSGALSLKGSVVEEYKQIKVVIKRIDKNNVTVEVIESGESFFSSKSQYSIKRRNSNGYALSMKDISAAVIDIDGSGNMEYVHPKVNIDGELYTLKIFAKR